MQKIDQTFTFEEDLLILTIAIFSNCPRFHNKTKRNERLDFYLEVSVLTQANFEA